MLVGVTDRYLNNATGAGRGSMIIQVYSGGIPQVIKEVFTQALSGKTIPLYKAVKNNRVFFSAKIMTNSAGTEYNEGIWSFGRKNVNYPYSLSLDVIDENVNTSGIQSFGNLSETVVDSSGKPHTIFYSRSLDVYIHVRVTYALHNEVELTPDIETRMRSAIEAYGDGLAIQEDVNPQRIMAVIYNNVAGIKDVVVEVARTATPNETPSYTTNLLPINRKEEAAFDAARILISQV
jgi:hypothetical protein